MDLDDIYIGSEHALDMERYFIVVVSQIESNSGHLTLFNLEPLYIEQVDGYLNEPLDSGV